jgi:hypothetical protein
MRSVVSYKRNPKKQCRRGDPRVIVTNLLASLRRQSRNFRPLRAEIIVRMKHNEISQEGFKRGAPWASPIPQQRPTPKFGKSDE